MGKAKAFSLDSLVTLWREFELRRARAAEDKKWGDEFKDALKGISDGADEFTLKGAKVAMLVPGQLNRSLLAKEQPQMIERYTRVRAVKEFDQVLFAQEQPELFEQYRAQRLVLTSEPSPEG